MTVQELGVILKGIAPVVREYVAKSLSDLSARMVALESKELQHGRDGIDGKDGAPGPQGEKGIVGPQGDAGPIGPMGEQGPRGESVQGPVGEKGLQGERGPEGPPGIAGRDGLPGVQGPKGLDGTHGKDGLNGKDGADGLGFDDVTVEHDGERLFTVKFVKGDQVKAFPFTLPIVLDRGVYKPDLVYVKGDGATWGGSFWIAQEQTSAKPGDSGTASRAWRLAVKAGRDGKQGPEGKKGLDGKDGRDGKDWGRG